ncbi:hypothetical protein [Mesorhizobium sp. Z1-4]|uniref:hypothetical protein n=1 Tax=Mesorhizobium sp. Z1-4 TaxID=2448478 RepID=UPI000FDB4194|nr:hypothetical protein [Mesorhizobium sp. Z1-4]
MKRIIALTTATFMGASMLAVPALALDVNAGADVGISGSADTSGTMTGDTDADIKLKADADTMVDTDTTAAISGSFDGALSAMGNAGASSASIQNMTDVGNVNVIWIKDLEGADMDALSQAEATNEAQIQDLRASLESNTAVSAALKAQSVEPADVVAANVAADGSLTVYAR